MTFNEAVQTTGLTLAGAIGMDYQILFNLAVGAVGFLGGVLLTIIWGEIKQLQRNEIEATKRINAIELLVAGDYVTRKEFAHTMDKIVEKLDIISNKIHEKADK